MKVIFGIAWTLAYYVRISVGPAAVPWVAPAVFVVFTVAVFLDGRRRYRRLV